MEGRSKKIKGMDIHNPPKGICAETKERALFLDEKSGVQILLRVVETGVSTGKGRPVFLKTNFLQIYNVFCFVFFNLKNRKEKILCQIDIASYSVADDSRQSPVPSVWSCYGLVKSKI